LAEIERLANEQGSIFPSEKKDVYYIGRKEAKRNSPGGILFNKLHNHFKKRTSKKVIKPEPEKNTYVVSSEMVDMVQKLKFYVGSEEDSMELWAATYDFRKNFISIPENGLDAVMQEFPLFKQATGFKFVSKIMPSFGI